MKHLNWGAGIALVYVTFATATVGFVSFALSQPVSLVSDDYYQHALDHDRHQAAAERGQDLGDDVAIVADETARRITVHWRRDRTRPQSGLATLYRPSDPAWDRRASLVPDPSGTQAISLADLPAGRWILQLSWTSEAGDFYVERTVTSR